MLAVMKENGKRMNGERRCAMGERLEGGFKNKLRGRKCG